VILFSRRDDSAPGGGFVGRLHRRYLAFAVGLMVFLWVMAALERMGLPRGWIGVAFMAGTVLIYAAIGFLCRTADEADYYVAGRRVPALYNGMATAADWMSAASFIGTAGVLYLQGLRRPGLHPGLDRWLLPGGAAAGALPAAAWASTRCPTSWARAMAACCRGCMGALSPSVAVSFVYVVVQMYGVGLITSHLIGLGFELGILVGLGGVLVCSFLGGMRAVTWTQVAQYLVLILAYLVPVVWLSVQADRAPVPVLSYAQQLANVSAREALLRPIRAKLEPSSRNARVPTRRRPSCSDVPAAMAAEARALRARIRTPAAGTGAAGAHPAGRAAAAHAARHALKQAGCATNANGPSPCSAPSPWPAWRPRRHPLHAAIRRATLRSRPRIAASASTSWP
jgi:cation/acetate symporter